MDPVETLRRYADRTDYIHFKDIDGAKYADVMGRHIRFFDACAEGVMCPIGRGRIDYSGLRQLLSEIGYGGYITIEQERDPRNTGGVLADLGREPGVPAAEPASDRGRDMKTLDVITIGRSQRGSLRRSDRRAAGGHGVVRRSTSAARRRTSPAARRGSD